MIFILPFFKYPICKYLLIQDPSKCPGPFPLEICQICVGVRAQGHIPIIGHSYHFLYGTAWEVLNQENWADLHNNLSWDINHFCKGIEILAVQHLKMLKTPNFWETESWQLRGESCHHCPAPSRHSTNAACPTCACYGNLPFPFLFFAHQQVACALWNTI